MMLRSPLRSILGFIGYSSVLALRNLPEAPVTRRNILQSTAFVPFLTAVEAKADTSRAVGSGEIECRAKGNCLEAGELDGALGWNWGAKDRCDPSNPLCGPDGRLREKIVSQAVPQIDAKDITNVAALQIEIGRGETGVLRIGFYGKDEPASVDQVTQFLSKSGLQTQSIGSNDLSKVTVPVTMTRGGVVSQITPGSVIELGVPSQSYAFARSRGLSKADGFVPQVRPNPSLLQGDAPGRSHSQAGLVSIPVKGVGHSNPYENDDEAFSSALLITSGPAPSLDKTRRVVGQILDPTSMAFLERLSSLPTKRGIRGVIPGQTSGPPLLKVVVRDTEVAKVSAPSG